MDSFPDFTVEYEAADGDVRMTTLLLSSCEGVCIEARVSYDVS